MAIEHIKNQKKWNKIALKQESNFMQSWEWGEFRKKNGITIFRIMNYESGIKNNYVQIEKRKLPFGKCYFYIAGINLKHKTYDLKHLLEDLKKLAKKERAIFLKIEPAAEKENEGKLGIIKGREGWVLSKNIQPKNTLVLDITLSEQELLKSFHHKHRYNIRLAEKGGISVKKIETGEEFESFYTLIQKTDERKHTKSFPKKYYKELFVLSRLSQKSAFTDVGRPSSLAVVFLGAYLKKKMIAGLILIVWEQKATYLVGASDYNYRKYMAPHLLQWEAIKLAKLLGAQKYDFWGIIKKDDFGSEREFEGHSWAGITRFKQGFGGKEVSFLPAYDYVFSPFWYKLYRFAKKIKI